MLKCIILGLALLLVLTGIIILCRKVFPIFNLFGIRLIKGIYPNILWVVSAGWMTILFLDQFWRLSMLTSLPLWYNSIIFIVVAFCLLFSFIYRTLDKNLWKTFKRVFFILFIGFLESIIIGFIILGFVIKRIDIPPAQVLKDKIFISEVLQKKDLADVIESSTLTEKGIEIIYKRGTKNVSEMIKFKDMKKIVPFPYFTQIKICKTVIIIIMPVWIYGAMLAFILGIFINLLIHNIKNII